MEQNPPNGRQVALSEMSPALWASCGNWALSEDSTLQLRILEVLGVYL
jgi:hypothetical protein